MAFGKYCGSTLGVVKLRTASFVLACLGSDQRYSSGLGIVREFWNLVVRNFVSQESCWERLRTASFVFACPGSDQGYSSGPEIVRKFWNLVVRNFVT